MKNLKVFLDVLIFIIVVMLLINHIKCFVDQTNHKDQVNTNVLLTTDLVPVENKKMFIKHYEHMLRYKPNDQSEVEWFGQTIVNRYKEYKQDRKR